MTLYQVEQIGKTLAVHHSITNILKPENNEPSLARIRKEADEDTTKNLLLVQLVKMSGIIGAELNKEQLIYLTEYIVRNYWFLTLSDFNLVTDFIVQRNSFEKPTVTTIVKAIGEYYNYRTNESERLQIAKANELKGSFTPIEDVYKAYNSVLANKTVKPLSQQEKDKIAKEINSAKIEELKKVVDVPDELKGYVPKWKEDEKGNKVS